ncbi:uncharacterized protein LOC129731307 [Wyeomyia smithii]|uniref:uncharacterized protein LOC129731307 n=1 Tax=Wyeomyia smithii TaxID=174621 RepID=UPI002467E969|nr:uncharacterized protein LOC129731307 [Wyeomyia smithii]
MCTSTYLLNILLVSVLAASAMALECFECMDVNSCNGANQGTTVQCDRSKAQAMVTNLKTIYPKVESILTPTDTFHCMAVHLTLTGQSTETFKSRGCVFDSKSNVCDQETISFNGNLECHYCNQDRCNGAAGLTWSFLLLAAGWIITRI